MSKQTADHPNKAPSDQALDQADAFGGVLARHTLRFDDGETMKVSPHPLLRTFDTAEQAELWDDYQAEIETYDRAPTIFIPEQQVRDADGNPTGTVLPAEEKPGAVLGPPYFKDGERVKPSHEVRTVQIALGEAKYARLLTKTIDGEPASYSDVLRLWTDGGERLRARKASDPK